MNKLARIHWDLWMRMRDETQGKCLSSEFIYFLFNSGVISITKIWQENCVKHWCTHRSTILVEILYPLLENRTWCCGSGTDTGSHTVMDPIVEAAGCAVPADGLSQPKLWGWISRATSNKRGHNSSSDTEKEIEQDHYLRWPTLEQWRPYLSQNEMTIWMLQPIEIQSWPSWSPYKKHLTFPRTYKIIPATHEYMIYTPSVCPCTYLLNGNGLIDFSFIISSKKFCIWKLPSF